MAAKTKDTPAYATQLTVARETRQATGDVVTFLTKGTTIKGHAVGKDLLCFSYRGKSAYVPKENFLRGTELTTYVTQHPSLFAKKATTKRVAAVRESTSPHARIQMSVETGDSFFVEDVINTWVKVAFDGQIGYIKRDHVELTYLLQTTSFPPMERNGSLRAKIVRYAKLWVGNPYLWGGTSLTSGADCSGFVQSVLKEFSILVPRCSYNQAETGTKVSLSKLKPGDLVFYQRGARIGHVAMYLGNGKVIQARGKAYGIVITDLYYDQPAWARNVIDEGELENEK